MSTIERERGDRATRPQERRGWSPGRILAVALVVVLIGTLVAVAAAVLSAAGLFFGGARRVDRTGPAVLQAVEDLSEYRAATGHFQVVVDLEQDDPLLPAFLRGERTLFVAQGTVDATVDFAGLAQDAVTVSDDRTAVTVALPPPTLSDAAVDPEESYVFGRQRGLIDRVEGMFEEEPTSERELYLLAEDRLEQAATDSDLVATAEGNTRSMLEGLLRSLGFTEVTVEFAAAP